MFSFQEEHLYFRTISVLSDPSSLKYMEQKRVHFEVQGLRKGKVLMSLSLLKRTCSKSILRLCVGMLGFARSSSRQIPV